MDGIGHGYLSQPKETSAVGHRMSAYPMEAAYSEIFSGLRVDITRLVSRA